MGAACGPCHGDRRPLGAGEGGWLALGSARAAWWDSGANRPPGISPPRSVVRFSLRGILSLSLSLLLSLSLTLPLTPSLSLVLRNARGGASRSAAAERGFPKYRPYARPRAAVRAGMSGWTLCRPPPSPAPRGLRPPRQGPLAAPSGTGCHVRLRLRSSSTPFGDQNRDPHSIVNGRLRSSRRPASSPSHASPSRASRGLPPLRMCPGEFEALAAHSQGVARPTVAPFLVLPGARESRAPRGTRSRVPAGVPATFDPRDTRDGAGHPPVALQADAGRFSFSGARLPHARYGKSVGSASRRSVSQPPRRPSRRPEVAEITRG
jgi:hypothetical protein